MNKIKQLTTILLALILTISISGCNNQNSGDADKMQTEFDQFIEQEFIDTMESDYTSLHSFIENPENFGIDLNNVEIGFGSGYSEEELEEAKKTTEETAERFAEFDRDLLTAKQQETYDIYQNTLELALESNDDKYDYIAPAFETATGAYCQIPTILTDWTVRNEQDVKDLITLVDDTDRYIQSLLDYLKVQEEKDTLSINVNDVVEYCQGIVDAKDNSPILQALNEKIDALNLDENQKNTYKQQLSTTFNDSFITAYQNIIDTVNGLDKSKINDGGLANIENGKEYYQLLLQNATASSKTVTEIQSEFEDAMDDCLKEMQSLIISNPSISSVVQNNFGSIKTNYNSYEEMMQDLATEIQEDFPDIGTIDYQIAQIDPSLANNSVAAYYNLPALDSKAANQIRVNSDNNEIDISAVDTFQTIAHEGLPGHMYQVNYSYLNLDNNYRKVLASNPSYQEGWAVYVQYYCNKYLSQQVNSDILELMKYNNIYSYYAMILCDIGIHYEGWDLDEFKDNLADLGFVINDDDSLELQYNQLKDNPTIFVPYYYGYLQFSNLKTTAKEELGNKFNDIEFHEALLTSGCAPFTIVEKNVENYIETNK